MTLDANGSATVSVSTLASVLNSGVSPQDLVFTLKSGSTTTGTATVNVTEGTQATTNTGPVNEGSAFNFSVATTNVAPGSVQGRVESYTITGPGLSHIPAAERSGTVTLDANGNATVTVHTLADLTNTGTTTVQVVVGNNAPTTVTINETAQQSVSPSSGTILEGAPVVFTINTTGVAGSAVAGQVETWTLSGGAAGQVNGPLSGQVTLDSNGSATVSISTLATVLNGASPQDLVFTLKSGSTTTATATVQVNEGTQTTTAPALVTEGNAFSFDVSTFGVAPGSVAGRVETYTITGPGLAHIPAAERTGQVVLDANGHATVTVHTLADLGNSGTTSISIAVDNNAAATVTINESAQQSVTPSAGVILEGASVVFTINTTGVAGSSVAGQVETWTLSGAATSQVNGPLSGTVILDNNGSATVSIATLANVLNDVATKDLVFTLKSGSTTTANSTVLVSEGTQSISAAPSTVNEGSSFNVNVITAGVAPGSVTGRTEIYTITGPGIGQIPEGERSGTVTLDANGQAVITVHTLATVFNSTSPDPTVTVTVGNDAPINVTIHEVATQAVSPSSSSILEGASVTFTVTTAGVLGSAVAGTVETWTLTGTATNQVTGGVLSGTVTLDANGQAVVTVSTDAIILNGPATQTLTFNLFNGGTPVTTANVTVNEGTQVVTVAPNPVNEGSTFNIDVATSGVAPGSVTGRVETYTITGPGINQIPIAERSGTVTLDANGHAVVTVHTLATVFNSVNPDPIVTVTVGNDAPVNVTIHEAAQQAVTPSSTSINQGSPVTFSVSTSGVPGSAVAGTVETWTLTGTGAGQVTGHVLSGTVTLDANGNAAVTVGTDLSVFNSDPTRPLTFTLFNGATPVTSSTVTINESTMTVTGTPNPIHEGDAVTFTIDTTNVPNGTFETWTLTGTAIGNVLGAHSGSFTINGNTASVTIQTTSNDISNIDKLLTLSVDGIPGAVGSVTVKEDRSPDFILTTGTDNFTGNAAGDNRFFATANSSLIIPSTLGQNDNLNGNSTDPLHKNTLFLTSQGVLPFLVNSFTTHKIQVFEINAGNLSANGTAIDMSSAFDVDTITDRNSSGSLQLRNVQAPVVLNIFNPTDIGLPVDVGLQYVAGQLAAVNAQNGGKGQVINLDPTVSDITGYANTSVNAPGVTNFTINSNHAVAPSNSTSFNGLVSLNQPLQGNFIGPVFPPFSVPQRLTSVFMQGDTGFVLGRPGEFTPVPGMWFEQQLPLATFTDGVLDLQGFHNTFFTVGDPENNMEAIRYSGGATMRIQGGDGGGNPAMQAFYPGVTVFPFSANGGVGPGNVTILSTFGSVAATIRAGDFRGQGIYTQGFFDSVTVTAGIVGSGGYVNDVVNAATIRTTIGNVTVTDLDGGLGSVRFPFGNPDSFIVTNIDQVNGGSILVQNVDGGMNMQFSSGFARTQIQETGNTGDMIADFSQNYAFNGGFASNTGFHDNLGQGPDIFNGGTGVNTLIFNPTVNNVGGPSFGEGLATNLQNLILQAPSGAGDTWNPDPGANGGGFTPFGAVGLETLGNNVNKPIDVYIGGIGNTAGLAYGFHQNGQLIEDATFTGVVDNERFFVDTFSTGLLNNDIFSFAYANDALGQTLNLKLQNFNQFAAPNAHAITIRDFSVNGNGDINQDINNPIRRLNFTSTAGNNTVANTTTLTIDTLQSLQQLFLIGTAAMTLLDTSTQAASINLIDGTANNSNIDLLGLMKDNSTQNKAGLPPFQNTQYLNAGNGQADALDPNGGIIRLGTGANKIAVAGGSWNITSDGKNTTIVVNPKSGDIDTIHATGGNVTVTIGANNGSGGIAGGGQVNITTDKGGNKFVFDQQGLPQLQSADVIHAGNGSGGKNATAEFDKIQIINGPLFFFDAGFAQVTGVEQLQLAAGFSNQLQLDFSADNNVATNQSGQLEIITGGGGFLASSTEVNVGAGYNHPLLFTVTAGGDGGGNNVTTHKSSTPGSNPLTVSGKATDIVISFEGALKTIQGNNEGIFASTTAQNELKLIADNSGVVLFGTGTNGINGVQTITGVGVGSNDLGVILLNDGLLAANPEKVNLTSVIGDTFVVGTGRNGALSIDGGSGTKASGVINTLLGGNANDTIRGHGTATNIFYGDQGGDTIILSTDVTGNGGKEYVVYNNHTESNSLIGKTDTVQNFHSTGADADVLSFNPAEFVGLPTIVLVGPNGGAASYADALTFLDPLNPFTQAVLINTGASSGQLWVDVDHDQNLNAGDYVINMTFASPPFLTSGNLSNVAPPAGTIAFQPAGSALFVAPSPITLTIPAWNISPPAVALPFTGVLKFVGQGGALTADTNFRNYDFSTLLSGVTFTTPRFLSALNPLMLGGKATGTAFDDIFQTATGDLIPSGLWVDGGTGGNDQLTLNNKSGATPTLKLVSTVPVFGEGRATNIQTLNLAEPTGLNISFGAGTAFMNINGRATNLSPNTIDTTNLNRGGVIDLSKDKGADVVNLNQGYGGLALAPVGVILLDGLATVNMNFSGNAAANQLTATIIGLHNLDQVVLNNGSNNGNYDLHLATIQDVTTLDMTASFAFPFLANSDTILSTAQVGGLKGFTNIIMTPGVLGVDTDLRLKAPPGPGPAPDADFTNVTLNTTFFELHVDDPNLTVIMNTGQLPLNGIEGNQTEKLIFADNGNVDLRNSLGVNYTNLGSVTWQTGVLSIDNASITSTRPHGITELHGNGLSTLQVFGPVAPAGIGMDLSALTDWDGILAIDARLPNASALRINSAEAVDMNSQSFGGFLNPTIIADGTNLGQGVGLGLIIDGNVDYDLSTPLGALLTQQLALVNFNGGTWTSIDFNGDNVNGLTYKITGNMLPSTVTTITGDTGVITDSLIVYNHTDLGAGTTSLANITSFSGIQNVSVIEQYAVSAGVHTFSVNDIVSDAVVGLPLNGVATIDLNNNVGDIALLNTTALSARAPGVLTGFDTHWDINNFNAGNVNATKLSIFDTVVATATSGVNFINVSGQALVASAINVVSGALAPVSNLFALADGSNVEQALALIAQVKTNATATGLGGGSTAADHVYFGIYGGGPATGDMGIYEVVINDAALGANTTLTFGNMSVNLIGVLHNVTANTMDTGNFV
ncbi:MAG: hypothetical protein U1E60_26520 [Reyranellaceae bacterium]